MKLPAMSWFATGFLLRYCACQLFNPIPQPDKLTSLSLGLIGNGSIGALIDAQGGVVWCCFPRFDGDPVFCSLLSGDSPGARPGAFTIELEGVARIEQHYIDDTPILVTRMIDAHGVGVEITDFCPRYNVEEG